MKKLLLLFIIIISYVNATEQKHILLLNSYHQGMTWVDNITKGVYDILEVDKNNLIVHIENMDTKRHNGDEYYNSLANLYKYKFTNIKFDIILCSDNNAFDFLKKHKNDIFGEEIPVVFSGVNDFKPSLLKGYKNYTGVVENFSDTQTVEVMLKLHPKAKEIYIINDYLTSGRAWEEAMRKNLKKYEKKIKITYAKNQTLKELQHTIRTLPKGTLVLMGVYFADKNKKYITFEKIGEQLLDISNVPVYCLLNFNISDGVIGGSVISGYHQGAMMAKLAMNVMQGIDVNDIDVVTEGANQFIFNQKALNKFNIDIKKLPKKSLIINNEKNIYEKYGFIVSIILIIFSILLVTIIFIYYKNYFSNEKGVLKLVVYGPIIFIPTIIAILIYSILNNNEQIHEENLKDIINTSQLNQKNIVRNEIEKLSSSIYEFQQDKNKLFEYINTMKYDKNGYLFALDTKGNILAHGTRKDLIGINSYNSKDINGIHFIKQIINNALINSLNLVEYQWENPSTKDISTKYVYSKFLPQYNIIIASGVYDDDIQLLINKKIVKLNKKNNKQIEEILWISLIILILFTTLAILLSNIIKKIFEKYNVEIDNKNNYLEKLNLSLEDRITKEVKKSQEKDSLIFQQSKMASMGEMIGNISHQWRQPLSVISTGVTGMKFQKQYNLLEDDMFFKTCDTINENAQYLSQTIDDFRNYIKNERNKKYFFIKDTIENLLKLLDGSIKNNNINIILDINETASIEGYPNELIQCLLNIVNNAKDALKDIEDNKYLFISVKEDKKDVKIIVKDNGNGIPQAIITKIFEPYFTTKHQSQGTGLGLSMTYNMITKGMQGSIDVKNTTYIYENKNYSGAKFTITLPKNIKV